MKVLEVDSSKTNTDWLGIPALIYKNDVNWIAPKVKDIIRIFDPLRNRVLSLPGADVSRWVLYDNHDRCIGRVAAFLNPEYLSTPRKEDGQVPTGGLGFFECIDDQRAANLLFEKACEWLKARGMKAVDGPINPGNKEAFWGALVDGSEKAPIHGMTYNPGYYNDLFNGYGFKVYYEQIIFARDTTRPFDEQFVRGVGQVNERFGISTRSAQGMTRNVFASTVADVYNGAWKNKVGHVPLAAATVKNKVRGILWYLIDKRATVFAYREGVAIGCYLNIPELNELRGGWAQLRYLLFGRVKKLNGVLFGVVDGHQKLGVPGSLVLGVSNWLLQCKRYDQALLTWIASDNKDMKSFVERHITKEVYQKFATYRFHFDRAIPVEPRKGEDPA